jgi:hypothetical protein
MNGAQLILQEREEQLGKHGVSVEDDVNFNNDGQLTAAIIKLIVSDPIPEIGKLTPPKGWNKHIWRRLCEKPYPARLIIAGAFAAAEYDRFNLQLKNLYNDLKS